MLGDRVKGGSEPHTSRSPQSRLRCAIYTRKSTEEGLEQEFNSLDAQREACAAFIASQVGLGWKLVPDHYDDGGISGGTMDRPALQRLLQNIRDRKVDVVVVYKIDRLTRSLADFAKIVEVFDGSNASFVSVTQQFNTTTSMGRLTLNVLLSFAQFEREVTAERIRDKIAASKKKGIWMGGTVPLGYRVRDRKLLIKEPEASVVRSLFGRYLEMRSVPRLAAEVSRKALAPTAEGGGSNDDSETVAGGFERYHTRPMSSGMLYKLLANPLYIGKLRHKGNVYDGEHEAIIDIDLFDRVQEQLAMGATVPKGTSQHPDAHLLIGILFDDTGDRMAPTHSRTRGRRYRYYISGRIRRSAEPVPASWRIPAPVLELVARDYAVELLKDHSRVAAWIQEHASADLIQTGLKNTEGLIASLSDKQPTDIQKSALQLMFRSITLTSSAIRFELNAREIALRLVDGDQPSESGSDPSTAYDNEHACDAVDTVTIDVPITLRRRGAGMRIVIDSPYPQAAGPDSTLLDLIARAHVYLDRLTGSSNMSTSSIASTFGVDRADVGRILPLASLSPAMLDAMLTGRQPASLTARRLARMDLPMLWAEQEAALQ